MPHDFDYDSLDDTRHRPWPLPPGPWLMTQTWCDLLFAHWPVERDELRRDVPACFELESFDGRYWLGIVPFRMANVVPRGVPAVPWLSAFPEVNVRTYVRVGDKPGVFFFSLDAARLAAVAAARALLNLPYFAAAMRIDDRGHGEVGFLSRRRALRGSRRSAVGGAALDVTYAPAGPVFTAAPGSLEHFLTERYCFYHVDRRGRPYRLDVHHRAWPLQRATATFERNTIAAAAGISLPDDEVPLLHFARRVDVLAWRPSPLV